ncbi:MAG: YidC/Oxa1 family membrane protein insertase [Firmicutes bacterium]|nr:YidC/Oxa1 family membrane protein insertase [Bacillota bacterium]
MGFLNTWFTNLLEFFFQLSNNYGVAIIMLTVTYKVVLLPLTWVQRKSMSVMKELTPLQQEIQEKYKNDPQEANKRIMELYKQHNANPFGGCLLSLLQLPIAFILFGVLRATNFEGASFLWISDLTKPDIILALLTGAISYLQMNMETTATSTNKTSTYLFPVFIAIMGLYLPSGLSVYLVSVYILSYFEVRLINALLDRKKAKVEGGAQK